MGSHHSCPTPQPQPDPTGGCKFNLPEFALPTGTCYNDKAVPITCPTQVEFQAGGIASAGNMSLDNVKQSMCGTLGGTFQPQDPCLGGSPAACAAALNPTGLVDGKVAKMIIYNDGTVPTPPMWYPAAGSFREFGCAKSGDQVGCGVIASGPSGSTPQGCPPATSGIPGILPCAA